jgi:ankyrin repeat protein
VYKLKETRGAVCCPVDQCGANFNSVTLLQVMSQREKLRYIGILESIAAERRDIQRLKSALIDVVTLKCPSCNITIDPQPDACSAILCLNCGNYYCNYCFTAFASGDRHADSAKAHTHCAVHSRNPHHRDAFLPMDVVREGQRAYQLDRLIRLIVLAMTSSEHGCSGGQDVALALILSELELLDLGFTLKELWQTAETRLLINSPAPPTSSSRQLPPSARNMSKQLWYAIITQNDEAAAQILTAGGNEIDVDYIDPGSGMPLLLMSVLCDQTDVTRRLLQFGANIRGANRLGRSLLFVVAEKGAVDVLKIIQELFPSTDWNASVTTEVPNLSMLHVAARYNRGSMIKALLELRSVSLNGRETEFGYSPLYFATLQGAVWAASLLLEAGADVTIQSNVGRTVLFTAIELGHGDIVRQILGKHPLLLNVSVEESSGQRPLHVAVMFAQTHIVYLLIELGADLNVITGENFGHQAYTPLHLALLKGTNQAALALIAAGADINKPSSVGRRPA